jgi:hypothetical protein
MYMARELYREFDDPNFDPAVAAEIREKMLAGKMTIHAALRIAKPQKYGSKSRFDKLWRAWEICSPEDKADFLVHANLIDGGQRGEYLNQFEEEQEDTKTARAAPAGPTPCAR